MLPGRMFRPLTVPPDLQLRPPSNEEPRSVASLPPASQSVTGQQPAAVDLQQPQDIAAAPRAEPAPSPAQPQQQQASTGEQASSAARERTVDLVRRELDREVSASPGAIAPGADHAAMKLGKAAYE